ncbi:MAG TPA: hypothetical protein VGM02_03105 [Acidobacteriaceae bacterium]|jgi:hypothetical protein
MASSSPASQTADPGHSLAAGRSRIAIAFVLLSVLYFVDTFLRATLKTFWYDELFTVYLCRLPTFHATWTAVLNGTDLNPPLFYLMTRWAEHWTGEALIATRLPAIIGFWIFGACLYFFVAPRLGRICGIIAAFAPWFTFAGYYAYEARPHGAVLAWCGLMLVCWQRSQDVAHAKRRSLLWLAGLFLCFIAALLTHVYAVFLSVPFLLVECDHLLRRRRIHLWTCAALLLPPCLVATLYLRMSRIYSTGVPSGGLHVHPYEIVQHFLITVFGPSLVLLVILLALLAWRNRQVRPSHSPAASLTRDELIVAIGLLLLPILGVLAAKVTHGPYFDRYFLAATAGYAMLLAQIVATSGTRSLVARGLLAVMLLFLVCDALIAGYCHWRHADLDQIGPGNLIVFAPDPARPFARNDSLLLDTSQRDILVTGHPDYLFLEYYAPPALRRRLIFAAPSPTEPFLIGYRRLSRWTGIGLQTTTFAEYFATHRDFLVYANKADCLDCTDTIIRDGFTLRSVKLDIDGRLEHFSR